MSTISWCWWQLVLVDGRRTAPGNVLLNQIAFRVESLARLRRLRAALDADGV